jgi:hypothetical protein
MSMILDGSNGVTFNDASLQGAAASPYVLKNRIINGAMDINQRAFSGTATDGTYSLDRYRTTTTQASKFTIAQSSTAPANFINSMLITSSSAYTPISTDEFVIAQNIEGLNVADLGWGTANAKTITLSFWVRSSLTGTFGGCISNDGYNRCYVFSYSISAANTWEQKTITIAGDTSGTWLTTNGVGIRTRFTVGAGSSYKGTAGVWSSSFYDTVTGAVDVISTNGATFYITGVQLEQNTSATPFERRLYGQELINCQRYFEKIQPASDYQMLASGFVTATTNGAFCLPYSIKRTSPSFTFTAGNTFAINNSTDTATTVTSIAINAGRIGTQSANVHAAVASGLTVGNGCLLMASSPAANCSISISAEL